MRHHVPSPQMNKMSALKKKKDSFILVFLEEADSNVELHFSNGHSPKHLLVD